MNTEQVMCFFLFVNFYTDNFIIFRERTFFITTPLYTNLPLEKVTQHVVIVSSIFLSLQLLRLQIPFFSTFVDRKRHSEPAQLIRGDSLSLGSMVEKYSMRVTKPLPCLSRNQVFIGFCTRKWKTVTLIGSLCRLSVYLSICPSVTTHFRRCE